MRRPEQRIHRDWSAMAYEKYLTNMQHCKHLQRRQKLLDQAEHGFRFRYRREQHRGRKTSQILRCLVTSVHSPLDNKVPDSMPPDQDKLETQLSKNIAQNILIRKKDQEKHIKACILTSYFIVFFLFFPVTCSNEAFSPLLRSDQNCI